MELPLGTEIAPVSACHHPETDEEIEAETGEDCHYEDRSVFPEDARFTDEEWAFVEAARARLEAQ